MNQKELQRLQREEIKKTEIIIDAQIERFMRDFNKSLVNDSTTPINKLYLEAVERNGIIDSTALTIQGGIINSVAVSYGIVPKFSADIMGVDSTKKLKAIYGAGYGKELSESVYKSVKNSQKEVYSLIQKNAKNYGTWKKTATDFRKASRGNLKGYQNIPKYLDDLKKISVQTLKFDDRVELDKALKSARREVSKLSDTRALKKSYESAINKIDKAIDKGDKLLLDKGIKQYILAKNQSLAERTVISEQARAYSQGIYDDYYDEDVVVGFVVVLSPSHPRFDMCDILVDGNPYDKNSVPAVPPHSNSNTTIQPYTGQKKLNKFSAKEAAKRADKNGLPPSSQKALKTNEGTKRVPANKEVLKNLNE